MRLAMGSMLVVAAVTSLGGAARAGQKAGVVMPDTVMVGGKQLTLNGMGLREATFLKLDVYVAGLYLETVSSDPAAIVRANETKQLVLVFVRNVGRGDIVKAWNAGFAHNATVELSAIRGAITVLNSWMPDFKKRDTLTFTYRPGEGVEVDIDNVRKGVIKNDDFARSLFAIWLGPKPPTGALKQGLLGKH